LGVPPTGNVSQDELDAVLLNWGAGTGNAGEAKAAGKQGASLQFAAASELAIEILDGDKIPLARPFRSRF
jgi:hypothetical protein